MELGCGYVSYPKHTSPAHVVRRRQTLYRTAMLGMGLGTWPYQICSATHILRRSITVSKLPLANYQNRNSCAHQPPFPKLGLAIIANL